MTIAPQRAQSAAYVVAHGGESPVELVGAACVLVAGDTPVTAEHGDVIEQLAAAQRVLHEVQPGTDPRLDVAEPCAVVHVRRRSRSAIGDEVRVDRLVVTQRGADRRAQPVGADERGPDERRPIGASDLDATVCPLHRLHGPADLEGDVGLGAACAHEAVEQIAAMHDDVRRAVSPIEVAELERGQLLTGDGVQEHQPARGDGAAEDLAQQTQAVEDPRRVRCELQPGTELGELRSALQDPDLAAEATKEECRVKPAMPPPATRTSSGGPISGGAPCGSGCAVRRCRRSA